MPGAQGPDAGARRTSAPAAANAAIGAGPAGELTQSDFLRISRILLRIAGIRLTIGKEQLVKARLWRRVHALSLDSFSAYVDMIESRAGVGEIPMFLDALTTNETQFFREPQHFRFLEGLARSYAKGAGQIRIWSAGCSTGEEAYSISITMRDQIGPEAMSRVRILATDLSTRALKRARLGVYRAKDTAAIPPQILERHFIPLRQADPAFQVKDETRRLVRFARLNLVDDWPMRGPFDIIFCRNVMIYFDRAAQVDLLTRFREILRPGGHLFLGHAESLAGHDRGFTYVIPAVYRR